MFEPAPELLEWMIATFVEDTGPLYNEDHSHLLFAQIGVLWTNVPCTRHGMRVLGQAEFKPPSGTMGKWQRTRAQCQLAGWGYSYIDFLLTFDAQYAASCSDVAFCALVEHELYHCGQQRDEFGAPKFSGESGTPTFVLRGHDIEEFVGVVKRYGAATVPIAALLEAAQDGPEIDDIAVRRACGTCHA